MSTTVHPEGWAVSYSTYLNQGCRCDGCRAAYSTYQKERRANGSRAGRFLAPKRGPRVIGDWADRAACKGEDMFPETGGGVKAAQKICASCPVIRQCAEYALEVGEPYGVWGGMSERERYRIRRTRRTA